MTFIDWSDPEGMFGLLVDFVSTENAECEDDPERQRFLSDLLAQLQTVEAALPQLSAAVAIQELTMTGETVNLEFADDPVMIHLRDCMAALEAIESGSISGQSGAEPAPHNRMGQEERK